MNSKASLGKTFTLFIATIAIVIILLIFIFGSYAIKEIDDSNAGLKIYTTEEIGLTNLQEYIIEYISLVKVRFLIDKGYSSENAITEANYEQ
jgi:hypothetical protein